MAFKYVDKTGNDSNDGSESTPWLTVNASINKLSAGDTLFIKAGTYTERIVPTVSGSLGGGYITITNFNDDTVVISGSGLGYGSGFGWYAEDVSYMIVDSLEFADWTGTTMKWTHDGTAQSNLRVLNCTFRDQVQDHGAGPGGHVITVQGRSQTGFPAVTFENINDVIIDNNTITDCATGVGIVFNEAITMSFNVTRAQITNNVIDNVTNIGIDCIGKDHTFSTDPSVTSGIFRPQYIYIGGNTIRDSGSFDADGALYIDGAIDVWHHNNLVVNQVGLGSVYNTEPFNAAYGPERILVTHNRFLDCTKGMGLGSSSSGADQQAISCRNAHDTIYTSQSGKSRNINVFNCGTSGDVVSKNNISMFAHDPAEVARHIVDDVSSYNDDDPIMDGDCYWPENPSLIRFWWNQTNYTTFAAWKTASGQGANSILANPLFTDAANEDVSLQASSPCLNSAQPLTQANGAGTNSTTLTVDDSFWFFDDGGMGITQTIRIGTTDAVNVTAVNHSTKQLTLAEARTWADNTDIHYDYNGTGPDRGAVQSGASSGGGGGGFSIVQEASANQTAGKVVTASFPSAPTEGNVILAIGGYYFGRSNTTMAITSPAGFTQALYAGTTGFAAVGLIAYKVAGASEGTDVTLTVTDDGTEDTGLYLVEVSGLDTANLVDVTASSAGSAGDITSKTSGTTAGLADADSWALAAWCMRDTTSGRAFTNGFTEREAVQPGNHLANLIIADKETSDTSPQETTLSWTSGNNRANGMIVVFKKASAATTPTAPQNLTATANGPNQIDLSWNVPTSDGGAAIIGYQIRRESPTGGGFVTIVPNTGSTGTTFSDTGLTHSTEFNYSIAAINAVGVGANAADAATTAAATVPTAPQNVVATATSSSSISVTWDAPASDGGAPTFGFRIDRESPAGGGFSVLVADTGNTNTTLNDIGLSEGTEYNYRVLAINSVGTGVASDGDSAMTFPILFEAGHDAGNLSEYANLVDAGNLSATAGAAMGGTPFGMAIAMGGTGDRFANSELFSWTTRFLNVRFYVNRDNLVMADSDQFFVTDLINSSSPSTTRSRSRILYTTAGGFKYEALTVTDSSELFTGQVDLPAGHVLIEFAIVRATTDSANDGSFTLYINGMQVVQHLNLDIFDVVRPNRIEFGAIGVDAGTTGTLHLDNLKITNDGQMIGALPSVRRRRTSLLRRFKRRR